jgi:beta-galactosidase
MARTFTVVELSSYTAGNYTLSVNCGTGANRVFVALLTHESSLANTLGAVTLGGVTVQETAQTTGGGNANFTRKLIWLVNPPSGTQTLSVTSTGDKRVVCLYAIDDAASAVTGAAITALTVSGSPQIALTSATGHTALAFGSWGPGAAGAPIGGVTEVYDANSSLSALRLWAGEAAGAASVTVGATMPTDAWVVAGLSIAPAAGGTAPTITVQPSNQSVTAGATATFSVTATGTALTYQWQRNPGGNTSFAAIGGATAASYTTPATSVTGGTANNTDTYRCVVTGDTAPTATSSAATLTVSAAGVAPTITVQPAAQSVTAGATATFSVTATGTALTYQWQRNPGGNTSFAAIGGATSASYTTPATSVTGGTANNTDTYRCVVTGSTAPAATSNAATLTVTVAATWGFTFAGNTAYRMTSFAGSGAGLVSEAGTQVVLVIQNTSTDAEVARSGVLTADADGYIPRFTHASLAGPGTSYDVKVKPQDGRAPYVVRMSTT